MWYRICSALFKRSCSSPRHLCVNECPPPGLERSASVRCICPNHAWEREKLDPPCGQKRPPNVSPGITFVPVPPPVSRSVKLRRKVTVTASLLSTANSKPTPSGISQEVSDWRKSAWTKPSPACKISFPRSSVPGTASEYLACPESPTRVMSP